MKIYISGPITGHDNAEAEFSQAELAIKAAGFEPINPFTVCKHMRHGKATWTDYMRKDIAALMSADVVYRLRGWQNSKGANIEVDIANRLGIPLFSQSNCPPNMQEPVYIYGTVKDITGS